MSDTDFYQYVASELKSAGDSGLLKSERAITSAQGAEVSTRGQDGLINMCANNYLGLSSHPQVLQAAHDALDARGFGMSSVRFICGTQDLHQRLEQRLSDFLGTQQTILYGSAFDANGGLFETLLDERDAVISDALNHASIIDGMRLCKARRLRYEHNSMDDLRLQLQQAREGGARFVLVFTDGVFSMDGTQAQLGEIRTLCDEFGALLGIDDCHATGFIGPRGRGSHELHGLFGRVDIITGTLGKALGGASGGFTSARAEVVELLRQRSRPYLFSNAVAPPIVGASLRVLDILESDASLRQQLQANAARLRAGLQALGFDLKPGDHPIIAVMLYEAELAQQLARRLLALGIYVVGFVYPVVPRGQARVRLQVSAAHTGEQLERVLQAFAQAGRELGLLH